MADQSRDLNRSFAKRAIRTVSSTLALIVLCWVLGDWLSGTRNLWQSLQHYIQNPFRIGYILLVLLDSWLDFRFSPRALRPMDEIPGDWHHWRNRMWETILVLAVFSDARGNMGIQAGNGMRIIGVILFLAAALLYLAAAVTRRREMASKDWQQFPVSGIFKWIRSPEHLSVVISGFASALIFNAWAGIFAAVFNIAIMVAYVHEQDRLMVRKFGAPWKEYSARVSRWIPWVW